MNLPPKFIRIPVTINMLGWVHFKIGEDVNNNWSNRVEIKNLEESRMIGFLGEIAFWKRWPLAKRINEVDGDFVLDGRRFEVKASSGFHDPNYSYTFRVYKSNFDRSSADFVFAHVRKYGPKYLTVALLGWMTKAEIVARSKFHKKGDMITIDRDLIPCESDHYAFVYRDLNCFSTAQEFAINPTLGEFATQTPS